MNIAIPELSLVLLVGPSGSGKSSFGRKHFLPTEVVSSDFYRGLVSDNENDQSATGDAFDILQAIVRKRLARGKLTVVDATNVQPEARKFLVELAREYHVFAVAIVSDLPEKLCHERNALRPDRHFGPHVVRNQCQQLRRSLRGLEREGIRYVFKLSSLEAVDGATIGLSGTQMYSLVGDGQPGRIALLERAVESLTRWRWWVIGAGAGCVTVISVVAWVIEVVVKRYSIFSYPTTHLH